MPIKHGAQSILVALVMTGLAIIAAPAQAAATGEHYQKTVGIFCDGNCDIDFPSVGASGQLNIGRMSCYLQMFGSTGKLGKVTLRLYDANNQLHLQEFLPVNAASTANTAERDFVLNQAVDVHVAAGEHVTVAFDYLGGSGTQSVCTATGTLFTQ